MIQVDDKRDTLIYGRGGSGKTVLAATAHLDPRSAPVYYICFRESPVSLKGSGIQPHVIKTLDELYDCYEWLATKNNEYRSVIIDTITTVHKHIFKDRVYNIEQMVDFGDFSAKVQDIRPGYYHSHELIQVIIEKFKELPIHTFFLGHAEEKTNSTGHKVLAPSFLGDSHVWENLITLFNNVWYLGRDLETSDRVLLLQEEGSIYAKTQAGFMQTVPTELINPRMSDIWNTLNI